MRHRRQAAERDNSERSRAAELEARVGEPVLIKWALRLLLGRQARRRYGLRDYLRHDLRMTG